MMICVIMNGCNLIFIIFGTSDVQPWNEPDTLEDIGKGLNIIVVYTCIMVSTHSIFLKNGPHIIFLKHV